MFKRGGAGVRWIVCILLFLAGVVWGKIIPKDYPQNLESLNQIFGIMSSIATMITVAIAVYGLNAWRQQIKGQADHQLAADLAVELVNLKEACRIGWSDARCCLLLNGNKPSPWLPGMWELEVSRLTSTLQYRGGVLRKFEVLLNRVRGLWGDNEASQYGVYLEFLRSCDGAVHWFLKRNAPGTSDYHVDGILTILEECEKFFKKEGYWDLMDNYDAVIDLLSSKAADAQATLDRKLMRLRE